MAKGKILVSLVTALYLSSSIQASANDGGAVAGALLGLFGAAVINNMAQQNQRRQDRRIISEIRPNQEDDLRAARAEIQRRLNDLGFQAGYPDGVYGPQSRQAIAAFQQSIGARADGKLTKEQVGILYDKTNGGGSQSVQANASPSGNSYSDQNYSAPAQAYSDPATQTSTSMNRTQPAAAANAEAWAEPATPVAVTQPSSGGAATAYVDPASPQVAQAAPGTAQPWTEPDQAAGQAPQQQQSAAPASKESVIKTLREGICREDDNLLQSVKAFITAGVVDKSVVIEETKKAIIACVNSDYRGRNFLTELAGKDITIPFWYNAELLRHGDVTNPYFGKNYLNERDRAPVLVFGNYAQVAYLKRGYASNDIDADSDVVRILKANINKRDCLGFPALYHAAKNGKWSQIKWLIENGANPNMPVPYMPEDLGFIQDGIETSISISDGAWGTKGYGLKTQYSCVDNGPSAALMNSYQSNNELVPLWIFIAKMLSNSENSDDNAYFLAKILPMIPSVPKTTIADLIDGSNWYIDANYRQHLDLIKAFVSKGADINAPTRKKGTPLKMWVANKIDPSSLQELLALGAQM